MLLFGSLAGSPAAKAGRLVPPAARPDPVAAPQAASLLSAVRAEPVAAVERGRAAACDTLFRQASRCLLLGGLTYRALAVPVPLVVLIARYGFGQVASLVVVATALVVTNVAAAVAVHRRPRFSFRQARPLLALDIVVAFGVNLYASGSVPGRLSAPYHDVFWCYLVGTVVLVTGAWGVAGGLAAIAASFPLQALMNYVNAPGQEWEGTAVVGRFLWLVGGLVLAVMVLAFAALGAHLAMLHGIRAGRASERARILRGIHDGVLQTLEAMSLTTSLDRSAPAAALLELRVAARAQALRLRRTLDELAGERWPRLGTALSEVAAEAVTRGVRAQLVVAELDDTPLTRERGEAVRDAVREALVNTAKHAGVDTAVIRVDESAGGIEVVVRDQGRGFDMSAETLGFGLRQSIVGRLEDVGGTAMVYSSPGAGTRVRMWVPL